MPIRQLSKARLFGLTALGLTFLITVGWQLATWHYSDDFVYLRMATGPGQNDTFWDAAGPFITSFSQVPEAVYNHWMIVNGRLSNAVYIVFQPFPFWVAKFVAGATMALVPWLLLRSAGRDSFRRPWFVVLSLLIFWTGFQWHDTMQSADFQFNYTLPTAMLIFIVSYLSSGRKLRWWFWVLLAVFAPWHECFTITAGVFIAIQWLYNRGRRSLLIIVGVLIAGCLLTYSPGTVNRIGQTPEVTVFALLHIPTYTTLWPYWLSLILWLVLRHRLKATYGPEFDRNLVALTAVVIVNVFITVRMMSAPRAHWAADALSVLYLVRLASTFKFPPMKKWLAVILLLGYTAWGTSLIVWQHRVTTFCRQIYAQLEDARPVIFSDNMLTNDDIPFWLMRIVHLPYGADESFLTFISATSLSENEILTFAVLPDSLKDKPFDRWPALAGNTGFRGVWPTIVRKPTDDDPTWIGHQCVVRVGEPSIAMSPIDRLFKNGMTLITGNSDTSRIRIVSEMPFEWMGDTLLTVHFERLPRTRYGRQVLSFDKGW